MAAKKSVKKVESIKALGMHSVGDCLYVQVGDGNARSWIARVSIRGKGRRDMGLGSVSLVTLAEARAAAHEARRQARAGIDPIEAREAVQAAQRLQEAKAITFKDAAGQYIDAHSPAWKNEKHKYQWKATLEQFAYPTFGNLPVASIDTALVTKALEPIWTSKAETATRLRGRIEKILDWAKVRGYREGENPARWRGHLQNVLAANPKAKRVKHLAALPFKDVGAFMVDLRERGGTAARALEFTVLTAARTGEVIGAKWSEIDYAQRLWIVPASRMKAGKDHRVPLSSAALDILRKMSKRKGGELVFPGGREDAAMSNMAMAKLLDRMGRHDITVHGFRSTFRDWASECTTYPREVCEMALAHQIPDAVEAAYRRGELLEKRRGLANDWARYCSRPSRDAKVISIRARAGR